MTTRHHPGGHPRSRLHRLAPLPQPTSPTPVQPPTAPHTLHDIIQEAIHDQDSIGWHHFLKGRLSKLWSTAQRTYYAQRTDLDKRKYTILRWRKRLTKSIIEGCITCGHLHRTRLRAHGVSGGGGSCIYVYRGRYVERSRFVEQSSIAY